MRTLSRGLAVLKLITENRGASFTEVRLETGLSKPVVHRILAELVNGGYIWRGVEEAKYYASGLLAVSIKGAQSHALMFAARDPLQKLVQQVQWPSDLFVRDGVDMVLIDTTQSKSPYALRTSKIGSRVPILLCPSGHAVLAEMAPADRDDLYEDLRRRGEWKRQLRLCGKVPAEIIADVQRRGFAVGEPNFGGNKPSGLGFLAIAAPVFLRSDVIGAVRIWWRRSADGVSAAQLNYLGGALKAATSAIAASLEVVSSIGSSGVSGRGYSENIGKRSSRVLSRPQSNI
jgi:IclR family transcriptional regulator, mhp operon transcriptional activator